MNTNEFEDLYWKNYLITEDDFMKLSRYITFDEDNYKCFSVEFIKQYQAICSELDSVCKIYCPLLVENSTSKSISDYARDILGERQDIVNAEVGCKGLHLKPWENWTVNDSPDWWRRYNKVKHERYKLDSDGKAYYKSANLKNVINALAGLFVLCMNCYKDMCVRENVEPKVPIESSKLFVYKD